MLSRSFENTPPPRAELEAKVLSVEVVKHKGQYAVYHIYVSFSRLNWKVFRRFSQFFNFDKEIRNKYPLLKDEAPLPSRFKKSLAQEFLDDRKAKLNIYLEKILSLLPLIVELQKCDELIKFLDVAYHLKCENTSTRLVSLSIAREYFPDIYSSRRTVSHNGNARSDEMLNIEGNSPIHWAAKQGAWDEILNIVRKTPASVLLPDLIGQTALHYAARHGQSHIVRFLVANGASVNVQCNKGWTPLQNACMSSDLQTVLTLLEDETVDVTIRNLDGNTALHYLARTFDNLDENMAKNCLKYFVDRKADVNAMNISSETPLHNACWKGCVNFVEALLFYGANPNLQNKSNETPLHWAARERNEKIVSILIQNGADVHQNGLFTPIMNSDMVLEIYNTLKFGTTVAEKPKLGEEDLREDAINMLDILDLRCATTEESTEENETGGENESVINEPTLSFFNETLGYSSDGEDSDLGYDKLSMVYDSSTIM